MELASRPTTNPFDTLLKRLLFRNKAIITPCNLPRILPLNPTLWLANKSGVICLPAPARTFRKIYHDI